MPNDCWNRISIKGTNEQLRSILATDFQTVPPHAFKKIQFGAEVLVFKLWSAWGPNRQFMNKLFNKYEGLWMINEWREEGGGAGVIVGTKDELSELTWDEGCIEEWGHRLRDGELMPEPSFNQNYDNGFTPSELTFLS